ncbi:MAG: 30S ribosomal protein S20 [Acidobacteriota bacterium]
MANHKSAEKRIRQTAVRTLRNRAHLSRYRTAVKKLRASIAEGEAEAARQLLPSTLSLVDHTAQKGVIHRNAAARTKSRLTRAVAAMG